MCDVFFPNYHVLLRHWTIFLFMGGWPFWVFFCMMFFVMCNVFINDWMSISSQGSSCFSSLWVVSVCSNSMESSIRKCISVPYWWCALITRCLGYKFLTLWWQGLNKSFKIIFPFCLFLVCPDAPCSQFEYKFLDQRGHSISNCQGVYNSLRELLKSDQEMSWSRFYMGLIK